MTEPLHEIERVEQVGCRNCDFEKDVDDTNLIPHLSCPECEDGSLERRFRFPNIDREICSCGRWPVAEDQLFGEDCLKCLEEIFVPRP